MVEKTPASAGDTRDLSSISEWERCPGKGNGNPLHYSYLENSMDRGSWQATVNGVAKSSTQLSMNALHNIIHFLSYKEMGLRIKTK